MAEDKAKGTIIAVNQIAVDGVVVLKIIKHCQEEGSSTELVNGFLVGLVVGDTLEVTNCFPLPKSLNDSRKESEYQIEILASLRKVNADYHQVGWYQSTYLGSHFTKDFFDSHILYQMEIEESVVLVYDPLQSTMGNLSIQAFRLTPSVLQHNDKLDNSSPESSAKIGEIFETIPVSVNNSYLIDALLCELSLMTASPPNSELLWLYFDQELESRMYALIESVEALQQETYKLLGYERNLAKQNILKQQLLQKKKDENIRRMQQGEKPLPIDEATIDSELNLKAVHAPSRRDALLTAKKANNQCAHVSLVSGQGLAKLYLTEKIQ